MSEALFHALFSEQVPLLDVRAEVEFAKGAFPSAVNLPILNDAEREQVGTCYRKRGPAAAVALGHRLVSGDTRDNRVQQWLAFLADHPSAYLYCFRGGQRSAIAAEWLAEEGVQVPRVPGGYKALRRYLLGSLEQAPPMMILAGRTGTGKTRMLEHLAAMRPGRVIDLEGYANHRGSAFGKRLTPQPTQINFENALAVDLLDARRSVVVEDEGNLIGRLLIPPALQDRMNTAPILVLNAALDVRVESIRAEYVEALMNELSERYGDPDLVMEQQRAILYGALDAIRKRLGGTLHREARLAMDAAFAAQLHGDFSRHDVWIRQLLTRYYDPMYDYQLEQRRDRVIYTGAEKELTDFAARQLDAFCPAA